MSSDLPPCAGVSLSYLKSFPIEPSAQFHVLCEAIKVLTINCSLVEWLWKNPTTKHFVKPKADVFVSYAWLYPFGSTMNAIEQQHHSQDIFIWLDVCCVNQHLPSLENVNFEHWTKVFGDNLSTIGNAFIVLYPAINPIAAKRSWCCFEWYVLASKQIPFESAMDSQQENEFINQVLSQWITMDTFMDIFSKINVANSMATKKSDQLSILSLMKTIGVVKVNNIVMLQLKSNLIRLLTQALEHCESNAQKEFNVLVTKAELFAALGEWENMKQEYEIANEFALKHSSFLSSSSLNFIQTGMATVYIVNGDYPKAMETYQLVLKNCQKDDPIAAGIVLRSMGDACNDQQQYADALDWYTQSLEKLPVENNVEVARTMNCAGKVLISLGDLESALNSFNQSLESMLVLLGPDHPDVAEVKENLAKVFLNQLKFSQAMEYLEQVLEIKKKTLGENHFRVGETLMTMGLVYEKQHNKDKALTIYQEALIIFETTYPHDHFQVVEVLQKIRKLKHPIGCILV